MDTPHGIAVVLNAPAVFRFTAPTNPELHLYAAGLMGADISNAHPEDAGELLASAIAELMRTDQMPTPDELRQGPVDMNQKLKG